MTYHHTRPQIAKADNAQMPPTRIIKGSVLGHNSDWWNAALLLALAFTALAAVAVVMATFAVITTQRQEARLAKDELDRYKAHAAAQVAEARGEGVKAGREAADANLRAAEARQNASAAHTRAAEANAEAATAQKRAAQANERAAALEKEAATARLEQERLKASFAWRTLDQATANALETSLASHPGTVNVWYAVGDPESMFLAIQFVRILETAHWNVAAAAANLNGIVFGIAVNDANQADGQRLGSALSSAGIGFSTAPIPPMAFTSGATRIQSAPLLMIGSKKPAVFP